MALPGYFNSTTNIDGMRPLLFGSAHHQFNYPDSTKLGIHHMVDGYGCAVGTIHHLKARPPSRPRRTGGKTT